MTRTYDDIINLPHHVSTTRPHMTAIDRAAQFSPFAALTGYDAAIKETARLTDERIKLDEYMKEALNNRLQIIADVQYLPQNYFETVCNEIGKVESLRREIEKVVFQYIPEDKRLKKNSFKELVDFMSESIDREMQGLCYELAEINKVIIELEDKKEVDYRQSIASKLAAKQEELRVHESLRPKEKQNPDTLSEIPEMKRNKDELQDLQAQIENYKGQITALEKEITDDNFSLTELLQLKRDIQSEIIKIQTFISSKGTIAIKYNLDISEVFSIKFNLDKIDLKISNINENLHRKQNLLGTEEVNNTSEFELMPIRAKVLYLQEKLNIVIPT